MKTTKLLSLFLCAVMFMSLTAIDSYAEIGLQDGSVSAAADGNFGPFNGGIETNPEVDPNADYLRREDKEDGSVVYKVVWEDGHDIGGILAEPKIDKEKDIFIDGGNFAYFENSNADDKFTGPRYSAAGYKPEDIKVEGAIYTRGTSLPLGEFEADIHGAFGVVMPFTGKASLVAGLGGAAAAGTNVYARVGYDGPEVLLGDLNAMKDDQGAAVSAPDYSFNVFPLDQVIAEGTRVFFYGAGGQANRILLSQVILTPTPDQTPTPVQTAAPTPATDPAPPVTPAPTTDPALPTDSAPPTAPASTSAPAVLIGIRIKSMPKNLTVTEGTALDIEGLAVEGIYNDGTFKEISDYVLSGFDRSKLGMQSVTVEYNGFTANFIVYAEAKKLAGIEITRKPSKRAYMQGEQLDTSDMVVAALYNNGTSGEIKDYTVSGYDPDRIGSQTVSVSYSGFSAAFTVMVSDKEQTSGTVETPKIGISSFIGGKTVTLTTATEGAQIYYTLDGTAPSTSSSPYSGPITLTGTAAIKAIAVKSGFEDSKTAGGKITVAKTEKPTASRGAGQVEAGTVVTLKSATSGAMIYYTTDGTVPNTESKRYSGGIAVTSNVKIKAIAAKSGNTNSDIFEISYTVPETEKASVSVSLGNASGAAGENISAPIYIFTEEKITSYRLTVNYDAEKFEYLSVTPPEGAEASDLFTSAGDGEVTVLYSGAAIESGEMCNINLKALESDEDGGYPISIQKDSVKIAAESGEKFNINITDGTITLIGSTNSNLELRPDVMLTGADGKDINDKSEIRGEVTANVTLENTSRDAAIGPMTVNIIMAVYDRQGCLVSMSVMDADLSDLNYVFTNTVDIPEGVEVGSIKLMVWNGLSDMTPMSAASTIL